VGGVTQKIGRLPEDGESSSGELSTTRVARRLEIYLRKSHVAGRLLRRNQDNPCGQTMEDVTYRQQGVCIKKMGNVSYNKYYVDLV
jgi:hypothetical protein